MAKTKSNFRSWKARAPKIPEYTCPLIDDILGAGHVQKDDLTIVAIDGN